MHALYVVQLHKELVRSKRLSGGPVAYLRSTEWAIKTVLYIIPVSYTHLTLPTILRV